MCSEAVWWRCHRRIIADYLIASGEIVFHILGVRAVARATRRSLRSSTHRAYRVLDSDWYSRVFGRGEPFKNIENEVQTPEGGFRFATSVGGTLTERGGDVIIIDDPLSAADAHSKTSRGRVNSWFSSTLLSRLDTKKTGAIIVIMQRLHPEDLTGHLMEADGRTSR